MERPDDTPAERPEPARRDPAGGDAAAAPRTAESGSGNESAGREAGGERAALVAAMAEADADAAAELERDWGESFDENIAFARTAVSEVADPGLVALLEETGLGDHPAVVAAAARIGRRLAAQAGQSAAPAQGERARADLARELEELMAREDYWSERVQTRVRRIHERLHGSAPLSVHREAGDGGARG